MWRGLLLHYGNGWRAEPLQGWEKVCCFDITILLSKEHHLSIRAVSGLVVKTNILHWFTPNKTCCPLTTTHHVNVSFQMLASHVLNQDWMCAGNQNVMLSKVAPLALSPIDTIHVYQTCLSNATTLLMKSCWFIVKALCLIHLFDQIHHTTDIPGRHSCWWNYLAQGLKRAKMLICICNPLKLTQHVIYCFS